jgi:fructosamine-3-kinase
MTLEASAPLPQAVVDFCRDAGFGVVIRTENLKGGVISLTRRLTTNVQPLILKQSVNPPADLYAREAEGLQVLAQAGLRTPTVYAFGANFLLLEDVGTPAADPNWEQAGRAIALLHQHTNDRFGFAHDNYLGMMPQINAWSDDGHTFFGQNRLLRYVYTPLCQQTLTAQDQKNIERLVARLPQLIPRQPASLLHGDLWYANVLFAASGAAVFIDPAVYYGWAEAELSMMQQYGTAPAAFYDAYTDVRPLEPGWQERLELLYLREILSVVAHFGNRHNSVEQFRTIVAKFL